MYVLVNKVAEILQKDKSNVSKKINKEKPHLVHKIRGKQGQACSAVLESDLDEIMALFKPSDISEIIDTKTHSSDPIIYKNIPQFYLTVLDPEARPNRVKFGFSSGVQDRWDTHKTVCPDIMVVSTWPCLREWEKRAIKAVTVDEKQCSPEVFDVKNVDYTELLLDKFFFMTLKDMGEDPLSPYKIAPENEKDSIELWNYRYEEFVSSWQSRMEDYHNNKKFELQNMIDYELNIRRK